MITVIVGVTVVILNVAQRKEAARVGVTSPSRDQKCQLGP